MGQKISGIEKFLAPSLNRINEEIKLIHAEIETIKSKIEETDNRITKMDENNKRLTNKMDKVSSGLPTEIQVSIDNINEMERHDREEIDVLKRGIDVAQRRIAVLESKMKELGK
jgi:uncharacterized coiled-coil DUF342 family protein